VTALFPASLRGFHRRRPPHRSRYGFILSGACLLFRVRDRIQPASTRSLELLAPSLRFISPSRHLHTESTSRRGFHAHLCSALSVSHALDGFLLCVLCGLVSSRYHVRDCSSGVFPAAEPLRLSPHRPLLVLATLTSGQVCPDRPAPITPPSGV
jgi:hypothetical protein